MFRGVYFNAWSPPHVRSNAGAAYADLPVSYQSMSAINRTWSSFCDWVRGLPREMISALFPTSDSCRDLLLQNVYGPFGVTCKELPSRRNNGSSKEGPSRFVWCALRKVRGHHLGHGSN